MGVEKQNIGGRFDLANVQHIDDIRFSLWPNLSRSAVLNMIVTEHRILTEAHILGREAVGAQYKHRVQSEHLVAAEPTRVTSKQICGKGEKNCA